VDNETVLDDNLEKFDNLPEVTTDYTDIAKPSEIAETAAGIEDPIDLDISPSEISDLIDDGSPESTDQIKVETADSSTKNEIDQIAATLTNDNTVEPIINVNVEQANIVQSPSSEKIEKTTESITNNYTIETEKAPIIISTDKPEILPSSTIQNTVNTVLPETTPLPRVIQEDPIATKADVNKILEANEALIKKEEPISVEPVDTRSSYQVAQDTLSDITKSINSESTKSDSTELTPSIIANIESPEVKQIDTSTRILTEPVSDGKLADSLLPTSVVSIDKLTELTKSTKDLIEMQTSQTNNSLFNSPSTVLIEMLREPNTREEIVNVLNEGFSQVIENIETTNLNNIMDFSPSQISNSQPYLVDSVTPMLTNDVRTNTEVLNMSNFINESRPDSIKESKSSNDVFSLLPKTNNETIDPTIINDPLLLPNIDEARIETNDKKLNADIVKTILTSPESKQLNSVNENLAKVQAALDSVNASQVSNNQNISNIINSTNNVTNTEGQKITVDESKSNSKVEKEEPMINQAVSTGLSEHYLHAIYDALVSHGIKLRMY